MKAKSLIRGILLATLGSLSYAIAVAFFYDPYKIAPGGVTGFAVIISHLFPVISTGTLTFIMNIPLLILALMRFGKRFVFLTIYSTALSSLMMNVFAPIASSGGFVTDDIIVAVLCGAVLDAVGVGLVYRSGGCTGGSDIIIKFLRQKYRHIRTGSMALIFNGIVVLASFIAFRELEIAIYSAIAITIGGITLDKVLYGGDSAKLLFIVSDNYTEITDALLQKLDLGVTLLSGEGAYLKKEKKIILCAAKKHNFGRIRDIVKETDPSAFMIISSANEIFGEGYKNQFHDEI